MQCRYTSTAPEYINILIACAKKEAKGHETSPSEFFINNVSKIQKIALTLLNGVTLRCDEIYEELLYRVAKKKHLKKKYRWVSWEKSKPTPLFWRRIIKV